MLVTPGFKKAVSILRSWLARNDQKEVMIISHIETECLRDQPSRTTLLVSLKSETGVILSRSSGGAKDLACSTDCVHARFLGPLVRTRVVGMTSVRFKVQTELMLKRLQA